MKKIKNLKKIVAAILILTFMVNLCLTVKANTTGKTHTITITGAGSGHEYVVYQVFTGNLKESTGEMGDIEWGTGVESTTLLEALKASTTKIQERTFNGEGVAETTGNEKELKEIFADCDEAYEVAVALSPYEDSSDVIREFAQIIGNNLKGEGVKAVASGDNYTVSGLTTGYYFIKDNKSVETEAQTRYILNLVKDSTIAVKADAPTMELKVNDSKNSYVEALDYQIGDTVEFQMIGKLPNQSTFSDYSQYKYIFHIELPEGLDYIDNSFKVTLKQGSTTTDIKVNFDDSILEDEVTIGCENIKTIEAISKLTDTENAEIVVTYNAKLNGTTTKTTKNVTNAYLEFSDNPNKTGASSTSTTLKNAASVYTYVLDIEKINGKIQTQKLDGVGFKIYEGTIETPIENKKWAKIGENGLITEWVTNEADATEMFTQNGGQLNIYGLDNKTYVLKETTTLDGFNTRDDMQFTISSTIGNTEKAQNVNTLKLAIKDGNNAEGDTNSLKFTLQVLNYPGGLLPETGGIGTVIFYVIGGILIVSAIILILPKKKKKEE